MPRELQEIETVTSALAGTADWMTRMAAATAKIRSMGVLPGVVFAALPRSPIHKRKAASRCSAPLSEYLPFLLDAQEFAPDACLRVVAGGLQIPIDLQREVGSSSGMQGSLE